MQPKKLQTSRFFQLGLFILLLNIPWFATAANNDSDWYQVNILIFTRLAKSYYDSEHWIQPDPLPTQPPWQRLSPIQSPNQDSIPTLKAFDSLPANQFQLTKEQTRLKNSRNYHVIFARSWIQPITSKSTKPVFFKGGELFDNPASDNNTQNDAVNGSELEQNQSIPEIQGLLTFRKTNYIQIKVNLRLTEPMEILPTKGFSLFSDPNQYQTFELQQTQRSRPNELHYFDHPLFGMLIEVTPYTPSPDTLRESNLAMKLSSIDDYHIRP